MDKDILIGICLVVFSVVTIMTLTLWSRQRIDRIARDGYRTARETLKEDNGD